MEENNSTKNHDDSREDLKWTADHLNQYYNTQVDRAIRALLLVDSGGIVIMASIIASLLPSKPPNGFIFALIIFVISLISAGFLLLFQVIAAQIILKTWIEGVGEYKKGSLSKQELRESIIQSPGQKISRFFGIPFGIVGFLLWIVGCGFSFYGLFQFKGIEPIW